MEIRMSRVEGQFCAREDAVSEAAARGTLPDDLRRHVETCPACTEAIAVAGSLHELAACDMEEPLPSPASTWWRLSLRIRREGRHRAAVPIAWMQRLSFAAWTLIAVTFLWWPSPPGFIYSGILAIGLAALGSVTLPVAIALW